MGCVATKGTPAHPHNNTMIPSKNAPTDKRVQLDVKQLNRQSMSLKKAGAKMNDSSSALNVKSDYSPADLAPFQQIFKENKGSMTKIRALPRFKGMNWAKTFAPKTADDFAVGILDGRAFLA